MAMECPNPNPSQTLCPAWIHQHRLGRDLMEIGAGQGTLSTEEQTQGVAEKRWEMQTPENVQMPCLVPPGWWGCGRAEAES